MNKRNKPVKGPDTATGRPVAMLLSEHSHGLLAVSCMHLVSTIIQILNFVFGWAGDALCKKSSSDTGEINSTDTGEMSPTDDDEAFDKAICIAHIAALMLLLLFDAILIRGAFLAATRPSSARRWVLVWIIFRAIFYCLLCLGFIAFVFLIYITEYYNNGWKWAVFWVAVAILLGLYWYGWAVVLKHYGCLSDAADGDIIHVRMNEEKPRTPNAGPA